MEHFYQNIEGWFEFMPVYEQVIKTAIEGQHFVEVGAWLGKSAAFMAVEIINSGKKIKFDVVDTWEGSASEPDLFAKKLQENGGCAYDLFLKNMKNGGVLDYIFPIRLDSVRASKLYENNSLDFVYIDAAHGYEYVKKDIIAWLPKVKSGGILSGDDYNWAPGVTKAVNELLPTAQIVINSRPTSASFVYTKP